MYNAECEAVDNSNGKQQHALHD